MNEISENQNEKTTKTTQSSRILNENLHDTAAENFLAENYAQENDVEQITHKKSFSAQENGESAESKTKTPKSIFHITAIVLIVLLVVAIVVQICVMINLKLRRDELNRRNDQLPVLPDDPEGNSAATSAIESAFRTARIVLENEYLKIVI